MSDSVMFLSVPRLILSWYIPRWYLTSPEPYRCYKVCVIRYHFHHQSADIVSGIRSSLTSSAASNLGSNWQKIWSKSLRMTLAKTFSRPLEVKVTKLRAVHKDSIAWWENGEYPVPMRHPHDHTVYACSTWCVDDGFKSRDEYFTALQTKTFLWRPLSGQEVLKPRHNIVVRFMNVFGINRKLYATNEEQCFGTKLEWLRWSVLKLLANLFQCPCEMKLSSFVKADNELPRRMKCLSCQRYACARLLLMLFESLLWAITKTELLCCHPSHYLFMYCWPCGSDQAG